MPASTHPSLGAALTHSRAGTLGLLSVPLSAVAGSSLGGMLVDAASARAALWAAPIVLLAATAIVVLRRRTIS
ncbi:hypothetical protein [Brachybacterium hainanense]|uniref:Major facilitator superfamily (MFS) profile domain-containing protein n=1 Tax=Brachybacterium hainanense TaxID=1541174 RepID=A0ABV6RA55_9MICO